MCYIHTMIDVGFYHCTRLKELRPDFSFKYVVGNHGPVNFEIYLPEKRSTCHGKQASAKETPSISLNQHLYIFQLPYYLHYTCLIPHPKYGASISEANRSALPARTRKCCHKTPKLWDLRLSSSPTHGVQGFS